MKLKKINDRIHYLEHDEEKGLPALGYVQGNIFSLMIDAGASPAHVGLFMAMIGQSGMKEPVFTVVTHHHWEHAFGLSSLETISIACNGCAKKLTEMAEADWNEAYFQELIHKNEIPEICVDKFRECYPDFDEIDVFEPDIAFDGEMTIDLGGCKVVLMHVPSSHSRDCVAAYVPEDKVIFMGDAASQAYVGKIRADDSDELTALMKLLRNLDVETCICSHYPPMTKQQLLTQLAERLADVK